MILADKIIALRKQSGWSQEQLAEKLKVSRQSVSKWEAAGTIPDINRIIEIGKLFEVSIDYLLNDNMEEIEYSELVDERLKRINLEEAIAYIEDGKREGRKIALAVMLFILSPVTLMVLLGKAEDGNVGEPVALSISMVMLFLFVAMGVAILLLSKNHSKDYADMKVEEVELGFGVKGVIGETKKKKASKIMMREIIGISLCIFAYLPLIIAGLLEAHDSVFFYTGGLGMGIVAIGVYLIVCGETEKAPYEVLLNPKKKEEKRLEKIEESYWVLVVIIYLLVSFLTGEWGITWIIWPVAGLLWAVITGFLRK